MSTLERDCRRLIRMLPKSYRATRAEEILGTLLDSAAPGQRRPRVRDAVSIGSLAIRLRLRALGPTTTGGLTGQVVRMAVVAGLLLYSASYATFASAMFSTSPGLTAFDWLDATADLSSVVGMAALGICLLFNWRRAGLALWAVVLTSYVWSAWELIVFLQAAGQVVFWKQIFVSIGIVIPLILTLPILQRGSSRMSGPGWWIFVWAGLCGTDVIAGGRAYDFYIIACAAAIAVALRHAKATPTYAFAFLVAGWPLYMTAYTVIGRPEPPLLPRTGIVDVLILGTTGILIATALVSVRRVSGRRVTA